MSWALRASMMQGHALRLKQQHSATSTNEDKNKENSTPVQLVKQLQTSSHRPMHVYMMVGLMKHTKEVQEQLLEEHICASENNRLAREAHERTMSALLAVVCEGLLTLISGKVFPAQSELISNAWNKAIITIFTDLL